MLAVFAWGLSIAVFGLVHWLPVACVLLALAGAADNVSAVFRTTILQAATPDEYRGRLQGSSRVVVAGGPRLGDVESGTMAAIFGETFSIVSGGIACIVVTPRSWPRCRRSSRYDASTRSPEATGPTATTGPGRR